MATKYQVTGSELTVVANAIRDKGGTTERLTWPEGYVTAIGNIQASGDKTMRVAHAYTEHNMENYNFQAGAHVHKLSDGTVIDPTSLTKIYDASVPFGSSASKVVAALGLHDEGIIASSMTAWNAAGACYYDAENISGACGGYSSDTPIPVASVDLFIGRYSGQNAELTVTLQYMDVAEVWHDVKDIRITTVLPYPLNMEHIVMPAGVSIYGVRWIHKKAPVKSKNNNMSFFGMIMRTVS